MFDWLIRNYEKGVRRLLQQRSGVIENRQPPVPGIIQVASADVISAIFDAETRALEAAENARRSGYYGIETNNASLGGIANAIGR